MSLFLNIGAFLFKISINYLLEKKKYKYGGCKMKGKKRTKEIICLLNSNFPAFFYILFVIYSFNENNNL